MALTFTDEQIREATAQVLLAPTLIEKAQKRKTEAIAMKQDFKDLDKTNEVYTNNFHNIIAQYHEELKYLNGSQRTNPILANIDPAARLTQGNVHYPQTPTMWTNFIPKITDDIIGNPAATWASTETEASYRASTTINTMKNGFNPGGTFNSGASNFTASTFEAVNTGGLNVGDTVIVYGSTGFALGTVTTIASSSPYIIGLTVTAGNLTTVGGSATAKNSDPGFSLFERDNGASGGRNQYLLGLRAAIDTAVQDFEDRLNSELSALNLNDAQDPDKTQILSAKGNINTHKSNIDTWQSYPTIGSGSSRHGTNLPSIESVFTSRASQTAGRVAEVTAGLGGVTQQPDGKFTGTGAYYKYFENLNLRLNLTQGTLRNYYQQDTAIRVAEEQIAVAQSAARRDSSTFLIRELSSDAVGTDWVKLKDVSGLAVSDSVKIMSNKQQVLNLTIVDINDLEVQLSASISQDYTSNEKARIVKQT